MARKHYRHHRRHRRYGEDFPALPALPGHVSPPSHARSNITDDVFKKPVRGLDVLVGGGITLLGIWILNWSRSKWASLFPPAILPIIPALAGVAAGGVAYMIDQKMGKPEAGGGHALGALSAGLAVTALNMLKGRYPTYFADVVDLKLAGLIVNDYQRRGRLNGLIVNDRAPRLNGYADKPSMGDLAALSMGVDDSEDIEQLLG